MHQHRKLRLAWSILICFLLQVQGADKYTDENRPYEFGFKIDGQQHRHESKDKDGIIMGEFGFITADDVYHVTVYATDKEGRFKILSMKNIHLKSSPDSSPGVPISARQGHALALPPSPADVSQVQAAPPAAPQSPSAPSPFKPVSLEKPGRSCSSCSIPTTTQAPALPANIQANGNNDNYSPVQFGGPGSSYQVGQGGQPNYPQQGPGTSTYPQQRSQSAQNYPGSPATYTQQPSQSAQNYPGSPASYPQQPSQSAQNYPGSPAAYPQQPSQSAQNYPGSPATYPQQPSQSAQNYPGSPANALSGANNNYAQPADSSLGQQFGAPQTYTGEQNSLSQSPAGPNGFAGAMPQADNYGQPQSAGPRTPKQYTNTEQQFGPQSSPGSFSGRQPGFTKPTLISAQMQIVDKNTDIHALRPGEKEGLPPGLNKNDMTQLLYTFNYTVGFHGHFEEGYTNGVKKGYYFVTGRNGVKTRIDYVADDTGFHPKVSQEVLDLLSDDVPKPETEKDEKFGLKGYEFKWLYYPIESERQ